MATTGEKFPTSGVSFLQSPWSDDTWVNPGNVVADDGVTASVTAASFDSGDQTYVLKASQFDFSSIPDSATILGVTARINAWFRSGQGSGSLDLCQLLDTTGAKVGTNQCATPVPLTTTNTTIITKGSSSDLWGNALTPAWVKDPNFGIALGCIATAANADVDIDYVTLEIEYSVLQGGSASGTIGWAGSAQGVKVTQASASGSIGWAGAADGVAPTSGNQGAASGAIDWAGTVIGTAPATGGGGSTGIIGYNVIGGGTGVTAANWTNEAIVATGRRYVAASGDVVTKVWGYGSGGTATCEVGVYVYSGGVPTTRVGTGIVTIGSTAAWYSATVNIPLTAGVEYVCAIDYFRDSAYTMNFDTIGGTSLSLTINTGALPATWNQDNGTSGDITSFYAEVTGAAPVKQGSTTGTISWAGSADGIAPVAGAKQGAATGTIEWAGVVDGVSAKQGAATGAVTWSGIATSPFSLRYPATISGRKLLDLAGKPYFMRTFSSWKMANKLSNAEITTALEGVAANGFNGVTVWCGGIEDRAGEGDKYSNKAGQSFWTGTAWRMNQGTTLGPAWASVDWIVDECARLGMVLHFSFCAGFGTGGAGPDWESATDADMHAVGVALATRYASDVNIVWHIMFDDIHGTTSTRGLRARALFDGINDTEGLTTRPVRWCEVNNGSRTDEQGWFGTAVETRFSVNAGYSYLGNSVEQVESWYSASGTLGAGSTPVPIMDCEPPYDGANHYTGNQGQQLRERSWALVIEGAVGINYGQEDWWPFGGAGIFSEGLSWTQVQTHSHTVQQSYVWDLVDQYIEDTTWAPASVIDNGATGEGTADTKAAQGKSDTAILIYFPDNRTVTVDTTQIPGPGSVRLRWYDPTTGGFTSISAFEAKQTGRTLTIPAARADGTRDWVFVADELPIMDGIGDGAISWAGSAQGVSAKQGAATGSISWVGSAQGVTTKQGDSNGAISWAGVVTGSKPTQGAATGAIDWVGVATGSKPTQGAATGAISWAGVAVGANLGVAVGAIQWVGSAAGVKITQGAATGTIDWAGSADGSSPVVGGSSGAATGTIAWVGSAAGVRVAQGDAGGAISWAGVAVGANLGVAIGAIQWIGTAAGVRVAQGAVTGTISWVGNADGVSPTPGVNDGAATGSITWVGGAAGVKAPVGDATGAISWVGVAIGADLGFAIGAVQWNGVAEGSAPVLDTSEGEVLGTITFSGSADGLTSRMGEVLGALAWIGIATSALRVDPAMFLLVPNITGYIPRIIESYKPGIRSGHDHTNSRA